MILPRFELGTSGSPRWSKLKFCSESPSYKTGALTRLSYRIIFKKEEKVI
jgi:hypothetical protein